VTQGTQEVCNCFNPLNGELNPIFLSLALLGDHPILHVSRIRVNRDRTVIIIINAIVTLNVLQFSFSFRYSDYIKKINLQCNANYMRFAPQSRKFLVYNTGLFETIVGVLTTFRNIIHLRLEYMYFFNLIKQHSKFLLHTL